MAPRKARNAERVTKVAEMAAETEEFTTASWNIDIDPIIRLENMDETGEDGPVHPWDLYREVENRWPRTELPEPYYCVGMPKWNFPGDVRKHPEEENLIACLLGANRVLFFARLKGDDPDPTPGGSILYPIDHVDGTKSADLREVAYNAVVQWEEWWHCGQVLDIRSRSWLEGLRFDGSAT